MKRGAMKIYTSIFLLAAALTGCSQQDVNSTKRQLHDAGEQAKQTAHKVGTEVKQEAQKAGHELKEGAEEASREVKRSMDDMKGKASHKETKDTDNQRR